VLPLIKRFGYMVVPKYFIEPIKVIYEQSSRFVPSFTQTIMSEFISKYFLNKHLRNVIKLLLKEDTYIY